MPLPAVNWKPQPSPAWLGVALEAEGSRWSALINSPWQCWAANPAGAAWAWCLGPAAIHQQGVSTQVPALGALPSAVPPAALIAARMLESRPPTWVDSLADATASPTSAAHSPVLDLQCPDRRETGMPITWGPNVRLPLPTLGSFQIPSGNWNWWDQSRYHPQVVQEWIFFHCASSGWCLILSTPTSLIPTPETHLLRGQSPTLCNPTRMGLQGQLLSANFPLIWALYSHIMT